MSLECVFTCRGCGTQAHKTFDQHSEFLGVRWRSVLPEGWCVALDDWYCASCYAVHAEAAAALGVLRRAGQERIAGAGIASAVTASMIN